MTYADRTLQAFSVPVSEESIVIVDANGATPLSSAFVSLSSSPLARRFVPVLLPAWRGFSSTMAVDSYDTGAAAGATTSVGAATSTGGATCSVTCADRTL